jgi:threonine dehydrogenase-like Zn-dependent dehydrogenase
MKVFKAGRKIRGSVTELADAILLQVVAEISKITGGIMADVVLEMVGESCASAFSKITRLWGF